MCFQYRGQQSFNVPPPRYNIVSPYNGKYTQFQLDMRRKAEVLQYKNNASSTKTNNLTRSQIWTQMARGNSNTQISNFPSVNLTIIDYLGNYQTINIQYPNTIRQSPSTQYLLGSDGNILRDPFGKPLINKNAYRIVGQNGYYDIHINVNDAASCAQDASILTPTTSSDVPGPIMYLNYDETVPLYNYSKKTASFSYDTTLPNANKWLFNPDTNILLNNGSIKSFLSLLITSQIDQSSYNYSLRIPFSMFITGTNISEGVFNDPSNNPIYFPNLVLGINSLVFNVKYSEKELTFQNNPTISIQCYNNINNGNHNNPVSLEYNDGVYNVPNTANLYPLQLDVSFSVPPTNVNDSYYANVYSGIIDISNILLPTEPGYIYDFYLQMNTTNIQFITYDASHNMVTSNNELLYYNSAIQNTDYGFFLNTMPSSNVANNCVTYPGSPPILEHIILSGR